MGLAKASVNHACVQGWNNANAFDSAATRVAADSACAVLVFAMSLVRHQAGAGLTDLPCQGGAANLPLSRLQVVIQALTRHLLKALSSAEAFEA